MELALSNACVANQGPLVLFLFTTDSSLKLRFAHLFLKITAVFSCSFLLEETENGLEIHLFLIRAGVENHYLQQKTHITLLFVIFL